MQYLQETPLLDYHAISIQGLIQTRKWGELDTFHRIQAVYNFVKDEILFGYNQKDALSASIILKDGYGQCNTKSILFMALLRALDIPCRIHGYTIDKKIQKGAMTGLTYLKAPQEILHSVVEVHYDHHWIQLEGLILDSQYLENLQKKFCVETNAPFMGYGVATQDFSHPQVEFIGTDTYIQKYGIVRDLGIYENPDELFQKYQQALGKIKKWIYEHFSRKRMNKNIEKIRKL